ncbi:MAG: hypothetical protein Q9210_006335 [Variospora velana]
MTDVKSKVRTNLCPELDRNDPDEDSDKEPEPPTKIADKPVARAGKRDAPKEAPSEPRGGAAGADRGGRGGRRGGFTGNDQGEMNPSYIAISTSITKHLIASIAHSPDSLP